MSRTRMLLLGIVILLVIAGLALSFGTVMAHGDAGGGGGHGIISALF